MAETKVIMPQMGESIFEGTLTRWLKKPGDTVKRDEPLFEISTDKIDSEIPAPATGTLQQILVQEGQTVEINTVVGIIGDSQTAASPASPATAVETAKPVAPDAPETPKAPAVQLGGDRPRQRVGEPEPVGAEQPVAGLGDLEHRVAAGQEIGRAHV